MGARSFVNWWRHLLHERCLSLSPVSLKLWRLIHLLHLQQPYYVPLNMESPHLLPASPCEFLSHTRNIHFKLPFKMNVWANSVCGCVCVSISIGSELSFEPMSWLTVEHWLNSLKFLICFLVHWGWWGWGLVGMILVNGGHNLKWTEEMGEYK